MVSNTTNIAAEGFKVSLHTTSTEHWRYNVALSINRYDDAHNELDFVSRFDRIADVGANLAERPIEIDDVRHIELCADDCAEIEVAIYVIPHTLPSNRRLSPADRPFEMAVEVAYKSNVIYKAPLQIDLWGGANAIIKAAAPSHL